MKNIQQFLLQQLTNLLTALHLDALLKLATAPAVKETAGALLVVGLLAKFGQPVLDQLKKTFGPLLLKVAGFLNKVTNGAFGKFLAAAFKALKPALDFIAKAKTLVTNLVDSLLGKAGLALVAVNALTGGLLAKAMGLLKKLLGRK